jgi:beta-lactamase class A
MVRFPALLPALLALSLGAAAPKDSISWEAKIAAFEAQHGGRLGVAALDTGSSRRLGFRDSERFPMCSTFKVLLAGAVLARVDVGHETLNRRIPYGKTDLLEYAPVTTTHVAEGNLSVEDLCAAAVVQSDNTAANLLLNSLGGPQAVTSFARSLGDTTTRLDRTEPELNTAIPGDPRDTTTPSAMVGALKTLLLGKALSPASRSKLESWMVACTTGKAKLRAGIPADWMVGDKTGSGARGTMNDIAILRPPPDRAPILVAVYYTGSEASWAEREAVLAEIGRLVAATFGD